MNFFEETVTCLTGNDTTIQRVGQAPKGVLIMIIDEWVALW